MRRVLLTTAARANLPSVTSTSSSRGARAAARLTDPAGLTCRNHNHHIVTIPKSFLSTLSPDNSGSALAKASRDGVVGHPIDFDVNSKIEGNESQIVTITLEPGQVLRAESGAMMYMTNGVEMNTTTG